MTTYTISATFAGQPVVLNVNHRWMPAGVSAPATFDTFEAAEAKYRRLLIIKTAAVNIVIDGK